MGTPDLKAATITIALAVPALIGAKAADRPTIVRLAVPDHANATPWVAADGAVVAVVWGATAAGKTDVYLAMSRDNGRTFASPVRVNATPGDARLGGELPPRVAVVQKPSAADPDVTVLWTARDNGTVMRLARSRDGGRMFGPPVTLPPSKVPGDRGWPALAVDRSGTAHAIWLDHRGMASTSGAASPHAGHDAGAVRDGVAMAQRSGLYYASLPSTGVATAGATTVRERELTRGVCYCCKTSLAVGSGGELYAAWRHVYEGNMRDIAFAFSRDGGRSFSSPTRVSEDKWSIDGCPDDGPAMAVDARGTVHLVWPTVVGGSSPQGALVYTSTRDGLTFPARRRIPTLGSPKPSHPQVAVDRAGRLVVAWDEYLDGQRIALARELRPSAVGDAAFGSVITLADGPATYPVLAPAEEGFVAVWATGGNASVIETRPVALP